MKLLSEDDPLARGLAELPDVPIDPAAAEAVRRRAVVVLVDHGAAMSPARRLAFAWSSFVLPGVLLSTGAVYTWGAVEMMGRIFVG